MWKIALFTFFTLFFFACQITLYTFSIEIVCLAQKQQDEVKRRVAMNLFNSEVVGLLLIGCLFVLLFGNLIFQALQLKKYVSINFNYPTSTGGSSSNPSGNVASPQPVTSGVSNFSKYLPQNEKGLYLLFSALFFLANVIVKIVILVSWNTTGVKSLFEENVYSRKQVYYGLNAFLLSMYTILCFVCTIMYFTGGKSPISITTPSPTQQPSSSGATNPQPSASGAINPQVQPTVVT